MYARFAAGLPAFVRRRITVDEAGDTVRWRLEHRGERFLRLVDRAVYGHPASPYLPLLRAAGCEPGDLAELVRSSGLEETLRVLRREGVYVTFEEFKGRTPIRRGGLEIPTSSHSFDNPFLARHFEGRTSGSTGVPTRIPHDLEFVEARTHAVILAYQAHDVLTAPLGIWRNGLPSVSGVNNVLRSILSGNVVRRWFAPVPDDPAPALRFRIATSFIVRACRLLGQPVPFPEPVPLERAGQVARWAERTVEAEGACLLRASPSMALRLGRAAAEEGIDLAGVTLMGGGEPVTEAKIGPAREAGARFVPTYALAEAGWVGVGCVHGHDATDVHILEDAVALIQHRHRVPGTAREVGAFQFTTLLSAAPRILLNVEMDDYGLVETRACGCPLGEIGYGTHVRGVRSYGKLTGEGVTLVGSDMERILEEVLPARFGGDAHDYQLHEREDEDGFTRLVLVVNPSVRLPDEQRVVEAVLDGLAGGSAMEGYAAGFWRHARSLRVERAEPEWGRNGKYPPLVVDR